MVPRHRSMVSAWGRVSGLWPIHGINLTPGWTIAPEAISSKQVDLRRTRGVVGALQLFVVWFGLVASVGTVWAAAPDRDQMEPQQADSSIELTGSSGAYRKLISLWSRRRVALEDGDQERADELLQRAAELRPETGASRLEGFGLSLIREALAASAAGDVDRAEILLEQAQTLAPDLQAAAHARARVALDRSSFAVHRWAKHRIDGFILGLSDFKTRMLMLSDLVLTGLLLFALVCLAFTIAQLGRYGLNVYQGIGETFPRMAKFLLFAIGALGLVVPLIFGFGPLLFFFPAMIAVWVYQTRSERMISVVLVLFVGGTPWLLRMGDRLSAAGTGVTEALQALSLNPRDARADQQLQAALADETDWQVRAVLGLAAKRRGDLDAARRLLREAIRNAPDREANGILQNNLGNVLFAQGHASSAMAAYTTAQKLIKDRAEPFFNRHRLLRRQGRRADAAEAVDLATQVDASRVGVWSKDADLNLNRFVVDIDLPASILTARALENVFAPTPFALRAWVLLAGPVPEMVAPGAAALALLTLAVLFGLRTRLRIPWACSRCARPGTALMVNGRPDTVLCEQCENLFVRNMPVERRARFEKEEAIERVKGVRTWSTRVAGVVLPGLIALTRGKPVRGVLVVALTGLLGLRLLMPQGLMIEPGALPSTSAVGSYVTAALLGLVWLHSLYRAARWKED